MSPECLVIGNGIAARLFALECKRNIIDCAVLTSSPVYFNQVRTITLNPISFKFLQKLDISLDASPISHINVFESEGTGVINFSAQDLGEDNLAYVINYDNLLRQLDELTKGMQCSADEVEDLSNMQVRVFADKDKNFSEHRTDFDFIEHDYYQIAFTFHATASKLQRNHAYQTFFNNQIFAIMPINDSKNTFTVVWSIPKDFATEEYVRDNIDRLGQQLDTDIAISGEILAFELSSSRAKEYCIPGKCLIADSAHSFHPLAGQGLNLGIADIDVLVDEFKKAKSQGRSLGDIKVLKKYEVRRKILNEAMLNGVNFLNHLFHSENIYTKLFRNRGLRLVNKIPVIKNLLIKNAVGKIKI